METDNRRIGQRGEAFKMILPISLQKIKLVVWFLENNVQLITKTLWHNTCIMPGIDTEYVGEREQIYETDLL